MEKYLQNNFLARYETFKVNGPKKPVETDTSNLRYSLKTKGLTGKSGFSLRDFTAKRLSAEHPKNKSSNGVLST